MKEGDNKASMGLSELSTIRNILMGQQMAQYDDTFSSIHNKIDTADKNLSDRITTNNNDLNNKIDQSNLDLNTKINELQESVNQRFAALEQDMNERFDRLEKLLLEKSQELDTKIDTVSTADKAALGQMLTTIGQRLIGDEVKN